MKKSICIEKIFLDYTFYDRFEKVREAGFDYIEFGSWEQHDVKKIKALLKQYGLTLGCFSGDKDYNLIDPVHRKEFIEYFARSLQVASDLNCKNLVMHSNALGLEGHMCTDGNDLSDRTKIACATRNLLEISALAEKAGITILLEPVSTYIKPGYYMTTTASAADIIRVVDSPNLKLLYDVYHMQLMEGDLVNTLRRNVDILGYIHIGDAPERYEPGTGEINFDRFKQVLFDELKYDGMVAFELSPKDSMEACIQAMHDF